MNKKCTIFYSWQSDIKVSRNFISDCLDKLRKKMKDIVLCDIDRDTQGLAGAPDIGDSIYEKIDSADIFIADVTIINRDFVGRKTPNPNVMIELGYAIKSLGWDRIILLYNKDFGEIEELPFDINHRRITSFTLKCCEEKARVRDYVLSCLTATIQILEQEHRLYGGSAETVKAQFALGQLIRAGLDRIWAAYVDHKRADEFDLYDKIPPISEAQFALVEKAHDLLTEDQYQLANMILFHMKMSRLGNDEMAGWEFADQLVPECFETLCIEFADNIYKFPIERILKKSVIELLNALSFENHIDYEEKRMCDDKVMFSTAADELYVCDREEKTLCKGRIEDGYFTGYKSTYEYEGEYVTGKRHGKGMEYCLSIYDVDSRFLVREGIWENDQFVEGRINDVLAEIENGIVKFVKGAEGGIITKKDWEFRICLQSEDEDYKYVDVYLKDDKYTIIEGSLRSVPKG